MEITHITTGAEKAGLSRSLIQKAQSTNNQTVRKPANTASPSLLSLVALTICLVLELVDKFENQEWDESEIGNFLEIDLDIEIGEVAGLELDPELEGLLWEDIVTILGLVGRLEDLQI